MTPPPSTGQGRAKGLPFCLAHTGASMNPTLSDRDLLEVVPASDDGVCCGDVILFDQPAAGNLIVHRAVGITRRGLLTQGDNNPQVDAWSIAPESVRGRVVYAWRGSRRRPIHGGRRGLLEAALLRVRRASGNVLLRPLRWIYHAVARSGLARRMLPSGCRQPRIAFFEGKCRYPMSLRLGRRTIGRYDALSSTWLIRLPYRLFVDESRLPRSVPFDRDVRSEAKMPTAYAASLGALGFKAKAEPARRGPS